MASFAPVVATLVANVTGFELGMAKARAEMGKTASEGEGHFAKLADAAQKHLGSIAAIAGGGLSLAGVAEGAKKAVDAYSDLSAETLRLQRLSGLSAEQQSRLSFAAKETGLDVDQLATAMKRMSVNVEANKSAFDKFKIATEDARGKTLPMDQILLSVADKFAHMPDGVDKTNEAIKLFGKQGADLIPFLDRGRQGIADLERESDKLGLTLNDKDTAAVLKNTLAKRQMHAAVEGLQVQIGKFLYPAVTKITEWFASHLTPAVERLRDLFNDYLGPALKTAAKFVGDLAEAFNAGFSNLDYKVGEPLTKVEEIFIKVGEVSRKVWDAIIDGVQTYVIPALQKLGQIIVDDIWPAIQRVWQFLMDHKEVLVGVAAAIAVGLVSAFLSWAAAAAAAAAATIAATAPVIAIGAAIAALVAGVIYAYKHWGWFKDTVDTVASFLKDTVWPILQTFASNLSDYFSRAVHGAAIIIDDLKTAWDVTSKFFKSAWDTVGAPVFDAVVTAVGKVASAFVTAKDIAVTAWNGMLDVIKTVWNGFVDAWNHTIGALPGMPTLHKLSDSAPTGPNNGPTDPSQWHDTWQDSGGSGNASGFVGPQVPFVGPPAPPTPLPLAAGGIIMRPTYAIVGESGPEAVIPLNRVGVNSGGGNTYYINVSVPVSADQSEVGRQIVSAIRQYERANSPSWRGAGGSS